MVRRAPVTVLLLPESGEEKPTPLVSGALFSEEIGRMIIGLEVVMGQSVRHDKGDGLLCHHVGFGVDGRIYPALPVRSCQHTRPFRLFKVCL